MENKGGFHEHLCPRVSASSFRPFKQARLFSGLGLLFYRRAGTRVWKKCSLQTTSVTTTVLEVGQQAGRVFSYSQAKKKKEKKVLTTTCVCVRETPPQPKTTTWPQRSLNRCTDTHTETLKSKQLHTDFLSLCCCSRTLTVSQWRQRVCWVTSIKAPLQCWMRKIENQLGPVPTNTTIFEMCLYGRSAFTVGPM